MQDCEGFKSVTVNVSTRIECRYRKSCEEYITGLPGIRIEKSFGIASVSQRESQGVTDKLTS